MVWSAGYGVKGLGGVSGLRDLWQPSQKPIGPAVCSSMRRRVRSREDEAKGWELC